jgi:preprotein translocase subunit SecG
MLKKSMMISAFLFFLIVAITQNTTKKSDQPRRHIQDHFADRCYNNSAKVNNSRKC